jgi:transposase
MPRTLRCPRCASRKYWRLQDGRRRCAVCRADWRPGQLPLRLTARQWRDMLGWFVRGLPSEAIARETGLHRKRVLRALGLVRMAMAAATGTLAPAVDAAASPAADEASLPRPASAVYGLRQAGTTAVAEVVPWLPRDVLRLVQAPPGDRPALPPPLQAYSAVGYRGRLYRLHPAPDDKVRAGQLEAFWAYVRRQLTTKGGVRRERLGLFLAEYTWRYAHRALTPKAQVAQLLRLLQAAGWREWDYASADE